MNRSHNWLFSVGTGVALLLLGVHWFDTLDSLSEPNHRVYEVNGLKVASYLEREGRVIFSGTNWTSCLMVDPEIKGDRVYIPPAQHLCDQGEFFFLDTLVKVRTAYATRAETQIYREDCRGGEPVVTDEKFSSDWVIGFGHIIINPKLEAEGLSRVYLDPKPIKFEEGLLGRRFVYRRDLVLLCHNP